MRLVSPSLRRRDRSGRRAARAAVLPALLIGLALAPSAAGAADAQLVSWGEDSVGKLANGNSSFVPAAVQGADGRTVTAAAVTAGQTFVVTPGGVLGAGSASNGGLGLGDDPESTKSVLTAIPGTADATAVAAGDDAALVLRADGTVVAFGRNQYLSTGVDNRPGGTGDGLVVASATPVAGLAGVRALSAGSRSALALKQDGTVWAWGHRETLGSTAAYDAGHRATPVQVPLPDGLKATAIASGTGHALALLEDGSVAAWGLNPAGALGDGTTDPHWDAARVTGLPLGGGGAAVSAISAGLESSFALLADGTIRAWGRNDAGQLGLGNGAQDVTVPTAVNPGALPFFPARPSFTAISAGAFSTYAIAADGRVLAWGYGAVGQLGSTTFAYGFPYPAATEDPQSSTEIPQRAGKLKQVPWLAVGSGAYHQVVQTARTLQPSISQPSFFEQQVGTLSRPRISTFAAVGDPSTVRRVRIVGPDAGDFLLTRVGGDPTFPLTLEPTIDSLSVQIRFAPSDVGERNATLVAEADGEVAQIPLDGFGTAPSGGPAGPVGPSGPPAANGAAGRDGINGRDGAPGRNGTNGRNGRNGVVTFAAGRATTVKRGKVALLRLTLRNGTSGTLPQATASLAAPKALGGRPARSVRVRALAPGRSGAVALRVAVGARARLGSHRVSVRLKLPGKTLTRAVSVRIVR